MIHECPKEIIHKLTLDAREFRALLLSGLNEGAWRKNIGTYVPHDAELQVKLPHGESFYSQEVLDLGECEVSILWVERRP